MLQRKNPLQFEMTKNQKERFLKLFQDYQDLAEVLCGFGGSAIVFRFGVIFTRILMILTFFRGDFDFVNDSVIQSTDFDFETTCNLISSLVHHSIRVYQSYPEQINRIFELSRSNQILYQELPDKFKRLEVLHLCKKFNISIPTLDRLLKNIQLFSKVGNGNYKKILMIK